MMRRMQCIGWSLVHPSLLILCSIHQVNLLLRQGYEKTLTNMESCSLKIIYLIFVNPIVTTIFITWV